MDILLETLGGFVWLLIASAWWHSASPLEKERVSCPCAPPISGHLPVEDVRAPPSPGPLTPRPEFALAMDRWGRPGDSWAATLSSTAHASAASRRGIGTH